MVVEHREQLVADTLARRTIDWGEVAAFVLDWVFALGEFVAIVLVAGLLGGYFGTFVDFVLVIFNDEWAGQGRQWGWILGAVTSAIGLPLGWVRRDGKRFSLPTPRELRKKVTTRVTQRGRDRPKYDFRGVRDILECTAACGLIGIVLGFILGGVLLMSWFSLAMSPLASADWFESLEFGRDAAEDRRFVRDDDRGGITMSTDHPIAAYLFFSPLVVLGLLGAVAGTIYGTVHYIVYLSDVPAGVRARERQRKWQPVVTEVDATAAMIEQRLPVLASPPRSVPVRLRYQLLHGDTTGGLLVGGLFIAVGSFLAVIVVLEALKDSSEMPLIAITLPLLAIGFGAMWATVSLRQWQRQINILRRGYLTRCHSVECKDPQSGRWKPYEELADELRTAWEQPVATVNTKADIQSLQRFATVGGLFALLVFTFMIVVGIFLTGMVTYGAIVENEPVAWFGILFMVAWWTVIVCIARAFWRHVTLLKSAGKQSLKTLGFKPIVECRGQFTLPDGKTVKFKNKIDLSTTMAAGSADPGNVAVYDPLDPKQVILCSRFQPALEVGEDGRWQFAQPWNSILEPGAASEQEP